MLLLPELPPTRLGAGVLGLLPEEPPLDELLPPSKLPNTPPVLRGVVGVLKESSAFWSALIEVVRVGFVGAAGVAGEAGATEGVDAVVGAAGDTDGVDGVEGVAAGVPGARTSVA